MDDIAHLLKTSKTIAIVGLSNNPNRDSYDVASYLQQAGYAIVPVNPNLREWKGIHTYAKLTDIPDSIPIDVIDIFRRSEFVEEIVDQALQMKHTPKAIWMQLGIENERAADMARQAGLIVIQNRCIRTEHRRYARL
jgi:uncharacterized protein